MKQILDYVALYLSSKPLTNRTRQAYRQRLSSFVAFLQAQGSPTILQAIKRENIAAYAQSLQDLSKATQAAYLTTLRDFFAFLQKEEILLLNPARGLTIPRVRKIPPFPLAPWQVRKILAQPDVMTILGLRDRAILETLYASGIRASELLHLTLQDPDLSGKLLFIREGKGSKSRWAPLTDAAGLWLSAYITHSRPHLVTPRHPDLLFCGLAGQRLQVQTLDIIVRKYSRMAGIRRAVYPHLFRHTAACHLLENGASLVHLQLFLGHASLLTTQKYTRVTVGHLKSVIQRCHPRA